MPVLERLQDELQDDAWERLRLAAGAAVRLSSRGVLGVVSVVPSPEIIADALPWLEDEHLMLYGVSVADGWDATHEELLLRLWEGQRRAKWPFEPRLFVEHLLGALAELPE